MEKTFFYFVKPYSLNKYGLFSYNYLVTCSLFVNRHSIYSSFLFICFAFMSITSCKGQVLSKQNSNENKIDLAKIYNQAIADYIDEATKQKLISTDTLYFGKRHFGQEDDFPNIELAPSIKNIYVRLIDPELGKKIQEANKSSIYINLVGWVESDKAEFIFVTFSNGFEHQIDISVNYQYNAKRKEYVLVTEK